MAKFTLVRSEPQQNIGHSVALGAAMLTFTAGLIALRSRMSIDLASPTHSIAPATMEEQIHEDVKFALDENMRAPSYAEWKMSGYAPADVFANIRALKSPAAWKNLCRELTSLPPEQLALFEGELHSHGLHCSATLELRLTRYWASRSAELSRVHGDPSPQEIARTRLHGHNQPLVKLAPLPGVVLPAGALPANRQIAITFEESAPEADRMDRILAALDRFGARATFFLTGDAARANPMLAKRIASHQHALGSLGWDEHDLGNRPVKESQETLARAQGEIAVDSGAPVQLFRYPLFASDGDSAGSGLPGLIEEFVTRHQRMHLLAADMSPADWKTADPVRLYRAAITALEEKGSGTIVFQAGLEQTAIVLPHFLEELRARGYTVVSFATEPREDGPLAALSPRR